MPVSPDSAKHIPKGGASLVPASCVHGSSMPDIATCTHSVVYTQSYLNESKGLGLKVNESGGFCLFFKDLSLLTLRFLSRERGGGVAGQNGAKE